MCALVYSEALYTTGVWRCAARRSLRLLAYDRVARGFFAVSARRNGRIPYTRCNFAERIHCIELAYPQSEKRAFDPVTTRISLSLRPR